ncbi:MAG TPA: hypothetical protein VMD27_10975 [Candidatus Aquilonibacter sp.]|nr:hypothetical protein [Candidatus Aquilonibacter sp.]
MPKLRVTTPSSHFNTPKLRVTTPSNHFTTPKLCLTVPRNDFYTPKLHFTARRNHFYTPKNHFYTPKNRLETPDFDENTRKTAKTGNLEGRASPRAVVAALTDRRYSTGGPPQWWPSATVAVCNGGRLQMVAVCKWWHSARSLIRFGFGSTKMSRRRRCSKGRIRRNERTGLILCQSYNRSMKPKIILCLAFVAFNLSAHARAVRLWSADELMAASDLVVIGQPIKVKDLDEVNSLGWSSLPATFQFHGVETTFKVSEVLKGTPASDEIVLHHYRETAQGSVPNGPDFVEFIPGDTNEYLLYLINDGTNRYAPATGQIDPSIKLWHTSSVADTNLTKQISEILTECQKIKPGMTRAELLKVFTMEGGFSTATHRTFIYRGCPYIKVDVDFNLSDPKQNALEERPTDTISKISKPYLDWSIGD